MLHKQPLTEPLSLSLYVSYSCLQSAYDRFAAELHLYVCVYLLINDLVIDGLHGMFYGGAAGNVNLWVRQLCELANGHTIMHGVLWQQLFLWPKNKTLESSTSAPSSQNNVL